MIAAITIALTILLAIYGNIFGKQFTSINVDGTIL